MNNAKEGVTPVQLTSIILSSILGVAILALPRFVIERAGTAAPLATLFGIFIAFIGLVAIVFLGKRFPEHTIIGYNELLLGRVVGRALSLLIIILFTILMGLETRQFAEIVAGTLLPNTPIQIVIILMIFLCVTVNLQHVSNFAYIHLFYMPLIILPFLVSLLPSFMDIDVHHLLPVYGMNNSLKDILSGGLVDTQAIMSFFVITMLLPFLTKKKKSLSSSILGLVIGSLFVIFVITVTLGVFGEEESMQAFWPTLILGRIVQIPTNLLSRIDAILLISWIYGVFTTLLSFYFIFVRGIGELLKSNRYRRISWIGFPLVFIVAILPKDIYVMYDYILLVTRVGLFLTVVAPVLLAVIAIIRNKRGVAT